MVINEDGILVEEHDNTETDKENSVLDESTEQTSQDDELSSSSQTQVISESLKRAAPDKISDLRLDRHSNKKKGDVPLENLVASCTSIGNSIATLLNPVNTSLSKENYHFGLSIAESLSKITNSKKKLSIKAQILLLIANEVE